MNITDEPLHDFHAWDAERDEWERTNISGYCNVCGKPIYGRNKYTEEDVYVLDDNGRTVHPTMDCMLGMAKERGELLKWVLEDAEEWDVAISFLDGMKRPERWLLEKMSEKGWLQK